MNRTWSAAVAVLLALTRPEGIGLVGIAYSWQLWISLVRNSKPHLKSSLRWLAVVAIGFGLFMAWRIGYYHDILPATVFAKQSGLEHQVRTAIVRLYPLLREWILIVVAFFVGVFGNLVLREKREAIMLILVLLVAYSGFIVLSGADWMPMYRFLVPLLPLSMLVIAGGVASLVTHLRSSGKLVPNLLLTTAVLILPFYESWQWTETRRATAISQSRDTFLAPAELGKRIKQIADKSTRLAVVDAGAIAYYSQVPVLDLFGLNNQYIAHLPGTFGSRLDVDYVLDFKPTWIEGHAFLTKRGNPIFIDFAGMSKLYYTSAFQTWYELDASLPLMPFKRLAQPRRQTIMDNFYSASIELEKSLPEFRANSLEKFSVMLSNPGSGVWVSSTESYDGVVYVVVQFISLDTGKVISEERSSLPQDVFPNESYSFDVNAATPRTPGTFTLKIDLLLNGITYFSSKGFVPWQQTVTINK